MTGAHPFSVLPQYPHMKPVDVHLWEKFLEAHPDFWETCDYDVLVGSGVVAGDVETDPYARSFQMLTQKKIDVVAYRGDEVCIIEIKPYAGSTALGQVLSYAKLWREKHPEAGNIKMAIITNEPQSDYPEIYKANGVELYTTGFCDLCRAGVEV